MYNFIIKDKQGEVIETYRGISSEMVNTLVDFFLEHGWYQFADYLIEKN